MKYIGSKAKLSKDLGPLINKIIKDNDIKIYIEPFVGGANMIEHIDCENKIGYDCNEYLIEMWNDLKNGWLPPKEITKEEYLSIKENKSKYKKSLVAIAGFCASYNAKWFRGYAGKLKTKTGKVRDYYDESVRNILKQLDRISDVEFEFSDYSKLKNLEGCLIYCDPPYYGTTKYKDDFNHDEFWEWVRFMSEKNIVIVSEYNAPEDFKIIYEKKVNVTLDKNSRKTETEKLFIKI